jgi:putative ABC transport system permease protein
MSLKPGAELRAGNARTTYYFGDEQLLKTLGLHLVAGRNFTAADVINKAFRDPREPNLIIVTKPLADKLYPKGDAIGKVVYLDGASSPSTIIGEVERLQVPSVSSWASSFVWNSTIAPERLNGNFSRYAIRTKPGRLDAAMRAATSKLYAVNPMRVLDDDSVKSFKDIRAEAYRADIGMAALMAVICLILLAVTAAGIVGLTSFWVGQRHRQIGVRRALGARKIDILHYFQLENLMIAGIGALVGIILAVGLNRMLMSKFEMQSMPAYYVLVGLAVVMLLGQIAVFVPARRASNVPPVVATRSV